MPPKARRRPMSKPSGGGGASRRPTPKPKPKTKPKSPPKPKTKANPNSNNSKKKAAKKAGTKDTPEQIKAKQAARSAKKADAKPDESKTPKDKEGANKDQDQTPEAKAARKAESEAQRKKFMEKLADPKVLAGLALLGLGVGLATALIAKSLADVVACENAVITITDISPSDKLPDWVPDWNWLRKLFPEASSVDVTYTCSTSYTPLENKETWKISGTGTTMDGKTLKILKNVQGKVVRMPCGADKCGNVSATTGGVSVNCSDFNDRANQNINDAATDIVSTIGRTIKSFMNAFSDNWSSLLLIVGVVVLLFFIVPKLLPTSKT